MSSLNASAANTPDLKDLTATIFNSMRYDVIADDLAKPLCWSGTVLGSVEICKFAGAGELLGRRRQQDIRYDHVDDFMIALPIDAQLLVQRGFTAIAIEPAHFVVLSTNQPYDAAISAAEQKHDFSHINVRLPGALLRQYLPSIDNYCDQPIRIRAGIGQVMQSMLELALSVGSNLSERQAAKLGDVIIDAITEATSSAPECEHVMPRRCSSGQAVYERAKRLIAENLSNPSLSPALIARQCGVSERSLQLAFAIEGATVASYVRHSRLEMCRRSLADASLRHLTVYEIALRWGFSNPTHFSRIYRGRFGHSPKCEREADQPGYPIPS